MIKFGQPHRHFFSCDSTNDAAKNWSLNAESPASSGALVTADFQKQGRGQRGHCWQAETGQSALMSLVYHLPPNTDAAQLGLVTALAIAEGLATLGVSPKIKWPNDLLLDGKKVGGILVEVADKVAVLGIGINVSQTEFPGSEAFAYPPTSLRLAAGREQSVESVVEAVNEALSLAEERWWQEGFALIVERCRGWLAVGATVRQGEVTAELIGLADNGAAAVYLPDGTFTEWTTVG